MSLSRVAQHLAAHGRGNDSMLVHMSPKEVSALQHVAMAHGGSLTVNPNTGLPEAKFLEAILPTIAGLGLAMIPGVGPLAAAGIVGGAQYARTGDLSKGLMAGLGAYGGAGLGAGLAGAGASSAAIPASPLPGLGGGPVPVAPAALPASVTAPSQFVTAPAGLPGLGGGAMPVPPAPLPASVANTSQFIQTLPSVPTMTPAQQMAAGLGKVTESGSAFGNFLKENKYPALAAVGATAAGMGAFNAPKPKEEEATLRPYTFSPGYTGGAGEYGKDYTGEKLYFRPTFTPMPTQPLAAGGSTGLESGGFVVPADVVSDLGNGSSSAGLELLSKRLGAKPIKGPGDGMSDSIPTSIEGKQKAAVARDEAYIPREQVAKAGGSKKLYAMMDKVRQQAHGKTKQQRKLSNPAKLVP